MKSIFERYSVETLAEINKAQRANGNSVTLSVTLWVAERIMRSSGAVNLIIISPGLML